MPKVSVIIPVYGVEEYIERCAISLFEQTIDDIEYVFIDDSTRDNSIGILNNVLDRYANRKSQVRIITHNENRGVSQARISGIQNATGDFIIHCDSDDWVDASMYETMYNVAMERDCDMVICDYENIYMGYSNICSPCYNTDMLQALLLCRCTGSLCNKLVKRQVFSGNSFKYPVASFCEDFVYSIQFAIHSLRIEYIPIPLYKYCHREGSLVTSKDDSAIEKRILDNLENHKLVEGIIRDHGLADKYASELIALRLIVKNSIRLYLPRKGYYKLWRRTYPELSIDIFKSKHVTWRSRFVYYVTLIGLYPVIKMIIRNA